MEVHRVKKISCGSHSEVSSHSRRLQRTFLEKVRVHFLTVPLDMKILGFKLCKLLVLLPSLSRPARVSDRGKVLHLESWQACGCHQDRERAAPGEVDLEQTWVSEYLQILLWLVYMLDHWDVTENMMNKYILKQPHMGFWKQRPEQGLMVPWTLCKKCRMFPKLLLPRSTMNCCITWTGRHRDAQHHDMFDNLQFHKNWAISWWRLCDRVKSSRTIEWLVT